MRSHHTRWLAMPALCVLGVLLAGVGAAQQPQQQPQTKPATPPAAEAPAPQEPESTPGPDIDQILEGEEEVLSGSGFTTSLNELWGNASDIPILRRR